VIIVEQRKEADRLSAYLKIIWGLTTQRLLDFRAAPRSLHPATFAARPTGGSSGGPAGLLCWRPSRSAMAQLPAAPEGGTAAPTSCAGVIRPGERMLKKGQRHAITC